MFEYDDEDIELLDPDEFAALVRETVDEMVEDFIDAPDNDLPPVAFIMTENKGMGIIPLAQIMTSEVAQSFVANILLPKLIREMNGRAFAVGLTAWLAPEGMSSDEVASYGDIENIPDRREAILLAVGFPDGTLMRAERHINRIEHELPDIEDWHIFDPVGWEGNAGILIDSFMGALTGARLFSPSMMRAASAYLAQDSGLNDELRELLAEQGLDADELAQIMQDEDGNITPEAELAILQLPQEFKDKIVAVAEEHMPDHGEFRFEQMLEAMHDQARAPFRSVADNVQEAIQSDSPSVLRDGPGPGVHERDER